MKSVVTSNNRLSIFPSAAMLREDISFSFNSSSASMATFTAGGKAAVSVPVAISDVLRLKSHISKIVDRPAERERE